MRYSSRCVAVLLIHAVSVAGWSQSPARWTVAPNPTVTIGGAAADTTDLLTAAVGATRLPDGRILVGDNADFSLRLFTASGRFLRAYGRKGNGPGEIGQLGALLRCGDSLVTFDLDGDRASVFSPDGRYVRSFRFDAPGASRSPYQSRCNSNGFFAHFGWEPESDTKTGVYRPLVPFWLSGTNPAVRRVFGRFAGSERYGSVATNGVFGSRPLPLGKQPVVAVGTNRVYLGTGDRYEILVFDFSGKQLAPIRKGGVDLETTSDDIRYAKEREIANSGPRARASVERDYSAMPLPKTVPAYAGLVVDADGHLWVQDYPRGRATTVSWSVFAPDGRLVAEIPLPVHLEVYEIGRDYVLGRFLDPDESVPQIRLYRLNRSMRR
ncbi:MAG: hypothetical protein IT359_05390 [Gemmatimonadaceae bacterium]|nr:hypothetical protein [Gemmatimonadaceae bacterium]